MVKKAKAKKSDPHEEEETKPFRLFVKVKQIHTLKRNKKNHPKKESQSRQIPPPALSRKLRPPRRAS